MASFDTDSKFEDVMQEGGYYEQHSAESRARLQMLDSKIEDQNMLARAMNKKPYSEQFAKAQSSDVQEGDVLVETPSLYSKYQTTYDEAHKADIEAAQKQADEERFAVLQAQKDRIVRQENPSKYTQNIPVEPAGYEQRLAANVQAQARPQVPVQPIQLQQVPVQQYPDSDYPQTGYEPEPQTAYGYGGGGAVPIQTAQTPQAIMAAQQAQRNAEAAIPEEMIQEQDVLEEEAFRREMIITDTRVQTVGGSGDSTPHKSKPKKAGRPKGQGTSSLHFLKEVPDSICQMAVASFGIDGITYKDAVCAYLYAFRDPDIDVDYSDIPKEIKQLASRIDKYRMETNIDQNMESITNMMSTLMRMISACTTAVEWLILDRRDMTNTPAKIGRPNEINFKNNVALKELDDHIKASGETKDAFMGGRPFPRSN